MQQHLDECAGCQHTLESLAGSSQEWQIAGQELDSHRAEVPTHQQKSAAENELEKLKQLLGPTDDPAMLGRIGNYEVCGLIGMGSTGIVVKAFEPSLKRYVAIKILAPSLSISGPARDRFEREGRSVAAVSDPHVVPIYAVDQFQGLPYIVMKYVAGGSLNQRIQKNGPLTTQEAVHLGIQIASALAAAHAAGIIHRDVKPANVLLEGNIERALVTDFGLARVADQATQTRSGVIAGTPQFMSPEQACGATVDARSDLFSLGSVLYMACTGHSPFRSDTIFGVIKKVCDSQPRKLRELNPRIAGWLEEFVERLHDKQADARFESATEVAELLSRELAHLNNPTQVAAPRRAWSQRQSFSWNSQWLRAGALPLLIACCLFLGFQFSKFFAQTPSWEPPPVSRWDSMPSAEPPGEGDTDPRTPTEFVAWTALDKDRRSAEKTSTSIVDTALHSLPLQGITSLQITGSSEFVEVKTSATGDGTLKLSQTIEIAQEEIAPQIFESHRVQWQRSDSELQLRFEYDADFWKERRQLRLPVTKAVIQIPGHIHVDVMTDGGNIQVEGRKSDVTAKSQTGRIDIGVIDGVTQANSTHGDIHTKISGGPMMVDSPHGSVYGNVVGDWQGEVRFSAAHGHVAIGIPAQRPLTIDAKAASGKISDPKGEMHTRGSYVHDFHGGGNRIVARTDSGSINVFRLRE